MNTAGSPGSDDPKPSGEYEIDASRRLVILRGPPPQEFTPWKATVEKALADPRAADDFNFLSDRRGSWPAAPTVVAQQVAHFLSDREVEFEGRRWAVVASEPGEYGMARMVGSLAAGAGIAIRAFYDYDLALEWLGAPGTGGP